MIRPYVIACMCALALLATMDVASGAVKVYRATFDGSGLPGEGVEYFAGATSPYCGGWDDWDTDVMNGTTDRALGRWGLSREKGNLRFLELQNLPAHSEVTILFDLKLAGMYGNPWDGNGVAGDALPDRFIVVLGASPYNLTLMDTTFSQQSDVSQSYPGGYPSSYVGLTGASGTNGTTHVVSGWSGLSASEPHSSDVLRVYFTPHQTQADEDWWVDNVEVWITALSGEIEISDVKTAPGGTDVILSGATVACRLYGGREAPIAFSVENDGRSAGIRVISSAEPEPGDRVTIRGAATTIDGERVIDATHGAVTVDSGGYPIPLPLGVKGSSIGGGSRGMQGSVVDNALSVPVALAAGVNNVGLLVKTWGRVTAVNDTGTYDGWFYVDDGSCIRDGSGLTGIRCRPVMGLGGSAVLPQMGNYVCVTGVSGVCAVSDINARYIWTVAVDML